jgi:hypothetical protein
VRAVSSPKAVTRHEEDIVTDNNTLTWRITNGGTPDPDRFPKVDWSTGPAGAANMLRAAIAVCDARNRELTSRGEPRWPASSTAPGIVVVVEEIAAVTGDPSVATMLEYLAYQGRIARVDLAPHTDKPPAEAFGFSSALHDYTTATAGR